MSHTPFGPLTLAAVLRADAPRTLADLDATVALRDAVLPLTAEERADVARARAELGKWLAVRR